MFGRVKSDDEGFFHIALEPGTYVLDVTGMAALKAEIGRCFSSHVRVPTEGYAYVDVGCELTP